MKSSPRALLLVPTFAAALAGCSNNADKPGAVNVENGAAKTFIPKEGRPATGTKPVGQDSAAAGLHRAAAPRPTGEQLYEHASRNTDHNHDGKADH